MRPKPLRAGSLATGLLAVLVFTAACGDDDDADQSAVCDAREDIDDDVQEIGDLDLADTSVNDVTDVVGGLRDELNDLSTAAQDELSPEVDDLNSSLDNLESTIEGLGSADSLGDAGDDLRDALDQVRTSATALQDKASEDC
jgi:uncharacterized phage infection (PIP) family protein YhgE